MLNILHFYFCNTKKKKKITSKIHEDFSLHYYFVLFSYAMFYFAQAIENKKLFTLDHHDALMPYLRRINSTNTKTYASRTLLLLQNDGTLKPLAIELSLPHPQGDHHGAVSKVFTPAENGVEGSVWQLAKAYVAVNDSGYHQLVSHWYDIKKENIGWQLNFEA